MSKKNELDQYGLSSDDEFYDLSFMQVSDEGALEVKPTTYAVMSWWKVRLGNKDTIDISQDSNHAMLNFDSTLSGGESEDNSFTEDDQIDLDHVIEVDETQMMVSLFSYIPKPIPQDLVNEIGMSVLNINPELGFGNIEIYTTTNDDGDSLHYLRYRAAVCLQGIKVGKVDAVENLVTQGHLNLAIVVEAMCTDPDFKDWVLN